MFFCCVCINMCVCVVCVCHAHSSEDAFADAFMSRCRCMSASRLARKMRRCSLAAALASAAAWSPSSFNSVSENHLSLWSSTQSRKPSVSRGSPFERFASAIRTSTWEWLMTMLTARSKTAVSE